MARTRLMTVLILSAAVVGVGCGGFTGAAPTVARSFASEAAAARQFVHTAVQDLDVAAANRAVASVRAISDEAAAASRSAGTAEAQTVARQTQNIRRQAELEVQTGWMDAIEQYGRDQVKDYVRKVVRRASCDVAHAYLERRTKPEIRQYAARVTVYLTDRLNDAATLEQIASAALDDFNVLVNLDPGDENDREVAIYLAETVFCPDAVAALTPVRIVGWGFNLSGEPVTVVDRNNRAVSRLSPNAVVRVTCTTRSFPVKGPYGTTSDLWDFIGIGFVPDSYLYTGTNDPVAGAC